MTIQLNHTVVWCRDAQHSSKYLADMLGLPAPERFASFHVVSTDNQMSLDFMTTTRQVAAQHYAFLVSEQEFDEIFGRIVERGSDYWADPRLTLAGEINRNDGGRGVYWADPDGHVLEIITRPYGSGR